MKGRIIVALLLVVLMGCVFAGEFEIQLNAESETGNPIPYGFFMYELLDMIPDDFDANWEAITVQNADGDVIKHQIDDLDGNGKLSSHDQISFFMEEGCKIIISDDWSLEGKEYDPILSVTEEDGEFIISGGA